MEFTPANPLEQALLNAREREDPEAFLAALADNPVYIPSQGNADSERELDAGETVELPVFEHDGHRFVPVFTSEEQLARGAPDATSRLRLEGRELAAIWPPGHAMAVNPGGDLSVALDEDAVRSVSAQQRVPAGSEVTIGAPAQEPEELWERLRAWASSEPAVRTAHRALMLVNAPGEQPQLVVGLELDPDVDPGRVLSAGAEALGREAAFTLVEPDGADPLSRWWRAQATPLYARP